MHAYAPTASSLPQPALTPQTANPPDAPSLAPGAGTDLIVTWSAPAIDGLHDAATGFNLRSSPAGAANWTTVPNVTSPYDLSRLAASTAIDVQIQSSNAAGTSAWSAISTLTTSAVAPSPPNAPLLAQGAGSNLTVIWTMPAIDSAHSPATGFNLRSSPAGTTNWTTVTGVTSPYDLSGLAASAAIDVQVQSSNAAGTSAWSATSTLTTAAAGPYAPKAPGIISVVPPPDGTTSKLTVSWTAPAVDSTHSAATGFNLRFSLAGAGTWTTVSGVTSPYTVSGLTGATAMDVQVQATNAAATPSAWSVVVTGTTWGATVAPGYLAAATSQVHGTSVAPSGGVNVVLTPAPTPVTGAAFAWSNSPSVVPSTGLIAAGAANQPNLWGQYINAPATPGTFYLWMLAQGTGGATTGALVTSAITVS